MLQNLSNFGEVSMGSPNKVWWFIQWNPSIKATQDGGLTKEVACHEG